MKHVESKLFNQNGHFYFSFQIYIYIYIYVYKYMVQGTLYHPLGDHVPKTLGTMVPEKSQPKNHL